MDIPHPLLEYIRSTGKGVELGRVRSACRILGVDCEKMTVASVKQCYEIQRVSPGVHDKLAEEMSLARDRIIKWIDENPDWQQIPKH
jgi:hypothetical protein